MYNLIIVFMSNKSVKGAPSYHYQGGRTTFPLSRDFTFTAAPGMLLPVWRKFITIGEKVKVTPKFFLRTDPLLAPSMTDIDVYVENYFVPMSHIMSMFNEWFTQVDDAASDMYTPNDWDDALPVVRSSSSENPFSWMTKTLFNTLVKDSQLDDYDLNAHSFGFDLHRLTNMLGYNAQALFVNASLPDNASTLYDGIVDNYGIRRVLLNRTSPAFCPYFYAAYQKIYFDVYRDSELEHNQVKAYNLDSVMNGATGWFDPTSDWNNTGLYWGSNSTRMHMFELRYRNRNKDYFTAIHPNPLFNKLGFVSNAPSHLEKIKNWLVSGLSTIAPNGNSVQSESFFNVSADIEGSTGIDTDWTIQTGNFVSGSNVYTLDGNGLYSVNDGGTNRTIRHKHSVIGTATGSGIFNEMNLATMRSNFAFEELLRVMNNAGRHADDQMFALFGVKLPQGIANEVYRLKSYHTMVHLGEVVSTAQTETSAGELTPLGEMAGRGSALLNSDNAFEFTAPCHGIVMSIFSIAPRFKYVGAVEKDGFKVDLFDFFRPQTDNLGQQPVFGYELGYHMFQDTDTTRLSWQYAHMEDKLSFDKATLAFTTNGLNPWSFCVAAPYFKQGSSYGTMYKYNKIVGNALDPLFVAQYSGIAPFPNSGNETTDGNWFTNYPRHYLRDPFKVDMHFDVLYTSSMTRFGEPKLGGI